MAFEFTVKYEQNSERFERESKKPKKLEISSRWIVNKDVMRIPKSVRHKAIQLQNNDQMPSERKKLVQFCGMWNSVQDDVRASIRL